MLNNLRSLLPYATERELRDQLIVRCFGRELADKAFPIAKAKMYGETKMLNEVRVIALVAQRLDETKIPYYISGGIASINYGEPRLTNDADIVISM